MVTDEEFKILKERVERLEELINGSQAPKIEINKSVKGIEINVGELPFMKKLKSVSDKCMALLNYSFEKDPHHSGLTPSEIEAILKEKFGLPVTPENISMSLKNATGTLVTREKANNQYRYRILQKGQDFIKKKIMEVSVEGNN